MHQSDGLRPIPPLLRKRLQQEGVRVKTYGAKINVKTYEVWNPLSRTAAVKCGKKVERVDISPDVVERILGEYKDRMYRNHQVTVYSRWYRGWGYSGGVK